MNAPSKLSYPHVYQEFELMPYPVCFSATSVDVEEHLYRLARDMGITVITSSQVPTYLRILILNSLLSFLFTKKLPF